jgi:hypothetical protein
MSDVPSVALWTLALVLLVEGWPLAAGLAVSMALLVRPNLLLVAAALFVWTALVDWLAWRAGGHLPARTIRLAIGVVPAVAGIAWLNVYLNGSPWVSGYGSLDSIYSVRHVWTNLSQFTTWTIETQTPIVAVAVLFFLLPRWVGEARIAFPRVLLGGVMLAVVVSYLFYIPFPTWSFLRFLLPMWPVLMLSTALALDGAMRRRPCTISRLLVLACIALAAWRGVDIADDRGTFGLWQNERKYVDVGRYIAAHTEPRAVMLSFQHSGSIRHYADRLTLRWDQLDVVWLDRAVDYLASTGRHPYIVVDGTEVELFKRLFGAHNRAGGLDWTPAAVLQHPRVEVYDASDRRARQTDIIPETSRGHAGWRCDRPQRWPTPLRME